MDTYGIKRDGNHERVSAVALRGRARSNKPWALAVSLAVRSGARHQGGNQQNSEGKAGHRWDV